MRNQILALLKAGMSPAEIRSRLEISENTLYYHVRNLRARGHIFPKLAARRGRQPKAAEQILEQWLAVKEQSRDRKIIRLLRIILEEAHNRQLINFETCRNPLPHQSPLLERHPRLKGYDGVTAISAGELRLLRGLISELEKDLEDDNLENLKVILTSSVPNGLWEKHQDTLRKIVEALKTFDLTNLRENARIASENPDENPGDRPEASHY